MGFNIPGLAINRNYKSDNLQKELGQNLEKQSEIDLVTCFLKLERRWDLWNINHR